MKKPSQRSLVVFSIIAVCTLLALSLAGLVRDQSFFLFTQAETYTEDLRMRQGRRTPVDPQLVLIGVDRQRYEDSDFSEASLQAAPLLRQLQVNWPWSRALWAEVIEKLSAAGAKAIVFDIGFYPTNSGDAALRRVLEERRDKVVIACQVELKKTVQGQFWMLDTPNPNILPLADKDAQAQDDRVGYVNLLLEAGRVRRPFFRQTGEQAKFVVSGQVVLESLMARTLHKLGRSKAIPSGTGAYRFRYGNAPGYGYRVHPIGDVLAPESWQANYQNGEFFRDKVVLIGGTAEFFKDKHGTPLGQMLGPEIHLNILAAALHGEFLHDLSRWPRLLVVLLGGVLAGLLSAVVRQPVKRLAALAALVVGVWFLAQALWDHAGLVIPVAVPLLVLVVSSLSILAYDFVLEQLERIKLRHTMGLYFSPRVLEVVLADPGSMTPRRAEVTMLLTDLRNSTPLAEMLGPQGMFDLLNRVFEVQTAAIMGEEGNLEHFLGDQFLSYWGAPQPQPDAALRAARAAIKLITGMEALRATLPPEVQKLFGYGVALHTGGVLVGNKGSAQRLDYGLVGDTVNEAARIEALTKYYSVKLLLSRPTVAQLTAPGALRLVDRVIVKGKTEPVELFEGVNPCTKADFPELCQRYAAAFLEYEAGRFAEARGQFEALVTAFGDGPSRVLAARCQELAAAPPTGWHGVWKMDSK